MFCSDGALQRLLPVLGSDFKETGARSAGDPFPDFFVCLEEDALLWRSSARDADARRVVDGLFELFRPVMQIVVETKTRSCIATLLSLREEALVVEESAQRACGGQEARRGLTRLFVSNGRVLGVDKVFPQDSGNKDVDAEAKSHLDAMLF